jgi:hypothetical protein
MPIHTAYTTLRQLTRLIFAVRKDGECRIDVSPDSIRLRACSEDRTTYLDHSVPTSAPELSIDDVTGSYWVRIGHVKQFLSATPNTDITIRLPPETENSTLTLQSSGLTYRHTTFDESTAHRLPDVPDADSTTELSLPNEVLDRAVDVTGLIESKQLQIQFDHRTHHIQFSGKNGGQDSFQYSYPAEEILSTHPSSHDFSTSIKRLRDITPILPPTHTISLELSSHHLTYGAEYPVPGADLTVYLAKYHDKIAR